MDSLESPEEEKAPRWSPNEDPWAASTSNANAFSFSNDADVWETGSDSGAVGGLSSILSQEPQSFTTPDMGHEDEFTDAQDDFGEEVSLEEPVTPASAIPLSGLGLESGEQEQQMDDWGDFDEGNAEAGEDDFGDFEEHDAQFESQAPIPQQPVS